MGLLAKAFSFSPRSFENPATSFSNPAQWLVDWASGGGLSASGMSVTQNTAIQLGAVWCATRVLAEAVASLPLAIYERQQPRGRRKAIEHDLMEVVHNEWNPDLSSFFGRECMQAKTVLHGNAYAFIRRDRMGRARELWPLLEHKVKARRLKGRLVYDVRAENGTNEGPVAASEILHIPGLSFNGLEGRSVIGAAREAIGLGLAAQKYGATLFSRGGRIPGVIETSLTNLNADLRKNIKERWHSTVGGTENWHEPAILPKGWTWKEIGIKPEDGQFLQTRKFQVSEIARWFKVPPHLLYDLERATFSNIEQQSLEFIVHSLRPWLVRWEQEMNRKLLSREERTRFFVEFNIDGLLRGDAAARGQFYSLGRQWGWLSANDVLDMENRPEIGDQGDIYLTPFNMMDSEDLAGNGAKAPPVRSVGLRGGNVVLIGRNPDGNYELRELPLEPRAPEPRDVREAGTRGLRGLRLRRKIKAAQRAVIEDRAQGIIKQEIALVEAELKKTLRSAAPNRRDLKSLRIAIDEIYREHAGWASKRMRPVIRNYAELIAAAMEDELGIGTNSRQIDPQVDRFVEDYIRQFGVREASESRLQLQALMEEGDEEQVSESIRQRLTEWNEKRPGKIATREATQAMAAIAKVAMIAAGVTVFRWMANAAACPFCESLDGQVAGVQQNFVNAGQGVDGGEGTDGPLPPSDNIGPPPLHSGCECDIVAG